MRTRDLTGNRFGKLVAVRKVSSCGAKQTRWECKCDCGNTSEVMHSMLTSGITKACGCMKGKGQPHEPKLPNGRAAINTLYSRYRTDARRSPAGPLPFEITSDEFADLAGKSCWYCGEPPYRVVNRKRGMREVVFVHGLDRIVPALGYIVSNVRACCRDCNIAKHSKSEHDFVKWLKKAVDHLRQFQPQLWLSARLSEFEPAMCAVT